MIIDSPIGVKHPTDLAAQIARLLDSDPIAARQVREHLSDERLIELLEITPPQTTSLKEALDNCEATNIEDQIEEEYAHLFKCEVDEVSDADLIQEVRHRWPSKAERMKVL